MQYITIYCMEIIEMNGYTLEEKVEIARRHLLPKQLVHHGLGPSQLKLAPDTLDSLSAPRARAPTFWSKSPKSPTSPHAAEPALPAPHVAAASTAGAPLLPVDTLTRPPTSLGHKQLALTPSSQLPC